MLAVNSDAFRRRQTSIVKKYFYQLVKQCTRLKKSNLSECEIFVFTYLLLGWSVEQRNGNEADCFCLCAIRSTGKSLNFCGGSVIYQRIFCSVLSCRFWFTEACSYGEFQCASGQCIDQTRSCDGYHDCVDRSDEINCGKASFKWQQTQARRHGGH